MNELLYFAIFVFSVIFWYNRKYGHRNALLAKFPSPGKSIPLINHSYMLIGKTPVQMLEILLQLSRSFESVWRLDLSPFRSFIVVQDPKIVEEILSSTKLLDKSADYDTIKIWLGTGLLVSTGKKWHLRRKVITPAFHFKILEQFVDVMEKQGDILVEKLKRCEGERINIFPLISLYTLDVICESAMGYQLNAQTGDTPEYVKAVKEMSEIAFAKIFDPIKSVKFFYQFSSMCKREQEIVKRLHAFTNSVISAKRKSLEDHKTSTDNEERVDEVGVKKKTAFLDLLLQTKIEGEPLSNEDIREEVDTFMFEGHDTTNSAIAFALLNLAKYQDVQKSVYEECFEIFGDDLTHNPSMAELNQMSYLERVIKETLRLYPSVPTSSRKFREDETICGYTFPANTTIRIPPFFMGRNPKLFPDPLKFDPSRFESDKNITLFSYIPFSAGPRNCIGQKFAMLEMKSILSKIVRNFQVCVRKEDENPVIVSKTVLQPLNGIHLYFKERKN